MKALKNNFLVKFILSLFIIGVVVGLFFFFTYKPDLAVNIEDFKSLIFDTHQNTFLPSILIILSIFITSISVIGIPAVIFYVFYEGLSIGFTWGIFMLNFKIKGFIFYLLFFVTSKLIYVAIMLYFVIISTKCAIKLVDAIMSKNKEELYRIVVYQFYRFLIVLFIIILNSTLVYLISNKLVSLFINLI